MLFGLNMQTLSFVIFILIVAALVYKDRRKVKLESGIVLMRRTQKGKEFINGLAMGHPRFWSAIGTLGMILAIPLMIIGLAFLANNAVEIIEHKVTEGVRFVLPYPTGSAETHPGLLLLPWWIWVIGIALVVIPHEFFHGIMCRVDNVRIKSLGWVMLLIIPGAFVEPDEKQLKRAKRTTKLKVYAAGSFANILTAILMILLTIALTAVFFTTQGIIPNGVVENSPAAGVNMTGAILAVNGLPIASQEDLTAVMDDVSIGDTVEVRTTAAVYNVKTVKHPESDRAYIGVAAPYLPFKDIAPAYAGFAPFLSALKELLFWVFVLSLGIGIVNILPIGPLDGGQYFEEALSKFTTKSKQITGIVSILVLGLLLFSIFGPMIIK